MVRCWIRRGLGCAAAVLWLGGCTATSPRLDAYAMEVESVRLDPKTSSPVLLLKEDGGLHRSLPIWIGIYEAQSIAIGLDKVPAPRPNTHDLIQNILDGLQGTVHRVVITELRDNTYYARLEVSVGGRIVSIDSRPSDAVAVAVRTGAPVYATEDALRAADDGDEEKRPLEIRWEGSPARPTAGRRSH